MRSTVARLLLFLLAAAAGWGTSELLRRTEWGSELVARFLRVDSETLRAANLHDAAAGEKVAPAEIDQLAALFRDPFADDEHFEDALHKAGLTREDLRERAAEHLRERSWIERQIAPALKVSDADLRAYFEAHRAQFTQPERYRANHLFVAAPDGSSQQVMAAKRNDIQGLSIRLLAGEKLPDLIAEASEDEATKTRGGDLNYFSALRMPPEFIGEVAKRSPGQVSGPIQSHLGFHLVQLTERKPARAMTFEEARPEIALARANQQRAAAVEALRQRLAGTEAARD